VPARLLSAEFSEAYVGEPVILWMTWEGDQAASIDDVMDATGASILAGMPDTRLIDGNLRLAAPLKPFTQAGTQAVRVNVRVNGAMEKLSYLVRVDASALPLALRKDSRTTIYAASGSRVDLGLATQITVKTNREVTRVMLTDGNGEPLTDAAQYAQKGSYRYFTLYYAFSASGTWKVRAYASVDGTSFHTGYKSFTLVVNRAASGSTVSSASAKTALRGTRTVVTVKASAKSTRAMLMDPAGNVLNYTDQYTTSKGYRYFAMEVAYQDAGTYTLYASVGDPNGWNTAQKKFSAIVVAPSVSKVSWKKTKHSSPMMLTVYGSETAVTAKLFDDKGNELAQASPTSKGVFALSYAAPTKGKKTLYVQLFDEYGGGTRKKITVEFS
jgi:hypothetical protein